tara:strand:- start:1143 stop:1946 length:804 start_codon:yes stop_codon:yes gene_type:complete
MKDFTTAFDILLDKIKNKDNFAFTRFSDGELFILQNKTVILAKDHYVTGDIKGPNIYTEEEQKEFIPKKHGFFREKLIECYLHNQDNFFKGICTGTDPHVGDKNFNWMIKEHGGDHKNLTFSNLLINANYKRFIEEMVPLFVERDIIYVANKNANISKLPFEVKKHFTVGSNCMINDYNLAEEIKTYIDNNEVRDYIILCSAASLSNVVTYECFKNNSNNTFIDIGSCLNPLLDLDGWRHTRGYLTSYWLNANSPFSSQVDVWQSIS